MSDTERLDRIRLGIVKAESHARDLDRTKMLEDLTWMVAEVEKCERVKTELDATHRARMKLLDEIPLHREARDLAVAQLQHVDSVLRSDDTELPEADPRWTPAYREARRVMAHVSELETLRTRQKTADERKIIDLESIVRIRDKLVAAHLERIDNLEAEQLGLKHSLEAGLGVEHDDLCFLVGNAIGAKERADRQVKAQAEIIGGFLAQNRELAADPLVDVWVIRCNSSNVWWGLRQEGYVKDLGRAGAYSKAEAVELGSRPCDEVLDLRGQLRIFTLGDCGTTQAGTVADLLSKLGSPTPKAAG